MRHYCYTSLAPDLGDAEFEAIISRAHQRNRALAIGGIVSFQNGVICQILEGPAKNLEVLVPVILADPRHCGVATISDARIPAIGFADFGMVRVSPLDVALRSIAIIDRIGAGRSKSGPAQLDLVLSAPPRSVHLLQSAGAA
ncbi:MAG: BLUF domain-containing protein [Fulvimarina manganoxydans]|uniref:BLUF domain-containing protein n=1 Tax=Fulvimarina manganoxydans TaxID=937218 RepID=UPI002357B25F|nr:BLUF domain-containing protein [Fulvimarina manganoxydans]MCK5931381.1 BLUF domain-containing protein [Fulvimarina manganoxydans]